MRDPSIEEFWINPQPPLALNGVVQNVHAEADLADPIQTCADGAMFERTTDQIGREKSGPKTAFELRIKDVPRMPCGVTAALVQHVHNQQNGNTSGGEPYKRASTMSFEGQRFDVKQICQRNSDHKLVDTAN